MTLTLPTTIARAALLDAACRSTGHTLASLLATRLTRHPQAEDAPAAPVAPVPPAPVATTTTGHPASTPLIPAPEPVDTTAALQERFGITL